MRSLVYVLVVFIFFCCGYYIVASSDNIESTPRVATTTSRDPAAIKKVYDFSNLDGSALDQASKQRLVSGAKLIQEAQDIGVELGHFVLRGPDGQKTFACQMYSKIVLVFEGDGMASAGEKPAMEVEGNCEISADINAISPLWIPVARILGEPVAEGDFDYRDGRPARVHFSNVREEWPRVWRLRSVRLSNAHQQGSEVTIEDQELQQYTHKPFIVTFK